MFTFSTAYAHRRCSDASGKTARVRTGSLKQRHGGLEEDTKHARPAEFNRIGCCPGLNTAILYGFQVLCGVARGGHIENK
jgi:hypothetical protein